MGLWRLQQCLGLLQGFMKYALATLFGLWSLSFSLSLSPSPLPVSSALSNAVLFFLFISPVSLAVNGVLFLGRWFLSLRLSAPLVAYSLCRLALFRS